MEEEKIEVKPKKIKQADLPPSVLKKEKRKKKAVRNFFTFIIIIALGVTIFWFGWIHPDLKPNQFATITNKITKTTTIYDDTKFCWDYFALIPTNVTVNIYDNSPHAINIKRQGTLPSGKFYSRYISPDDPTNFDYAIDMQVIYQIKEEALVEIVKSGLLTPVTSNDNSKVINADQSLEGYLVNSTQIEADVNQDKEVSPTNLEDAISNDDNKEEKKASPASSKKENKKAVAQNSATISKATKATKDFHQSYAANLTSAIYAYLTKRSSQMEFVTRLALDNTLIQEELSQFIQTINPDVKLIATVVNQISIPDYELYQQIKNSIKEEFKPNGASLELQQQMLKDEQAKIYNMNKIEALQELGKVLTTYPVLMDYLKTYASSDKEMELLKLPK